MTFYEAFWFILVYSFLGWCLEILFAAFTNRKFMNRGLLNGPFCPLYGCIMVFILVFFRGLNSHPVFLFLACTVTVGVMELGAGFLMSRIFKRKWWDYSEYKYNIGGYVSIPFTLSWGIWAVLGVKFFHPLLRKFIRWMPKTVGEILLMILGFLLVCDLLVTAGALLNIRYRSRHIRNITDRMNRFSVRLGNAITAPVQKRVLKAYPNLKDEKTGEIVSVEKETPQVFAAGCSFHKIVWLFMIGAFLGDLVETVFCRITSGVWMSRSSVIYGPFSIVWGLAVAGLTFVLNFYKDRGDRYIFVLGTVLGGVYEYVCSVFTEIAFGTVFWDYSKIPFNIGGRINLLYCFFWGIAAVVWIRAVYPFLSGWIEKIPVKPGKIISYVMILFMVCNMAVSALALVRYSERSDGKEAHSEWESFLDEHYPDDRMEKIYPNAIRRG